MKKQTLQDQYLLIKEGKGHKGVFLNEAKRQFPNLIPNSADVNLAAKILKDKNIISENIVGLGAINDITPSKKESFELAFDKFIKEAKKKENEKAELKKTSKSVEEDLSHMFDKSDKSNPDNLIFDQIMKGYYTEMKDPKNSDKTMEELKSMVIKNLEKNPIHYTEKGQFGVKDLGYVTEHPGLGTPKEAKGKYKASGYGNLSEGVKPNLDADSKLRSLIRTIIKEELEASTLENVGPASYSNPKSQGGGKGRRYIPDEAFLSQEIIDKLNFSNPGPNAPARDESLQIPHIKFLTKPDGAVMLISDFLYNAMQGLERGRTSREKEMGKNELEKLISDMDPMARTLIKKNVDPKMSFGNYHVVNLPIEREKGVGVKIPLSEELTEMLLNENVHKRLKEIDNEVQDEVTHSKLTKLMQEIEKRQTQLNMIDENEDLKELTDKNKIKSLQKEIKLLEKMKTKLEKKVKKQPEVIDETENEETEY